MDCADPSQHWQNSSGRARSRHTKEKDGKNSENVGDELDELKERYEEMGKISRQRQAALKDQQAKCAALELRSVSLSRQLREAGIVEQVGI